MAIPSQPTMFSMIETVVVGVGRSLPWRRQYPMKEVGMTPIKSVRASWNSTRVVR